MTENLKIMKIIVLLFSAALIIVAAAGVVASTEQQRTYFPVNGNVGNLQISWHYPDFEDLVLGSDLIVVATVSDKTTVWGTDDGKKPPRYALCDAGIYTCYPSENFEVLKGNVARLCIRVPGGSIDGYTMTANPVPELEVGDTVLLFLKTNYDENGNYIVWYHAGTPNVFTEAENGGFNNDFYGTVNVDDLKEIIQKFE